MGNTTWSIRQKSSTFFGNEGCSLKVVPHKYIFIWSYDNSLLKEFVASKYVHSSVFDFILAPPYCKNVKNLLGHFYLP